MSTAGGFSDTLEPKRADVFCAAVARQSRIRPAESRAIFAVLYESLTQPGSVVLPRTLVERIPAVVLPVLVLADAGVDVAVIGVGAGPDHGSDSLWSRVIPMLSGARSVAPGEADVVAVLGELPAATLATLRRAEAGRPELGARVFVSCTIITECRDDSSFAAELDGAVRLSLTRPGTATPSHFVVSGQSAASLRRLAGAARHGRAGIDIWLVDHDGVIVCVPRGSRLEVSTLDHLAST